MADREGDAESWQGADAGDGEEGGAMVILEVFFFK